MGAPKCSDDEFIAAWNEHRGHAPSIAAALDLAQKNVFVRRRSIENRRGISLSTSSQTTVEVGSAVVTHRITDGIMLVGSDAHIWPGPLTTMQRAFLYFVQKLKPDTIIANGDMFDGARISRFSSIGWERKPEVADEIEAVQNFLGEVERLRPQAKRIWPLGNHDMRFESTIATRAPEFARVNGVHLKDHFPLWIPCWRADINDDIVVRHRELGGEHADYRNVVSAGKTIVTGHDHRAGVKPYRNYRGTHYGVRCGYMADSPRDPQFVNYLEGKEPNWHPSLGIFTFRNGRLLTPELVSDFDETHVQFRGEVIEV